MNNRTDKYRRGNRQRGAALVEMAIVILVFLMLVFGILEFARAMFEWSRLVEATRAGTRFAIVNDPACDFDESPSKCDGGGPLMCSDPGGLQSTYETIDGDCSDDKAGCQIVKRMRGIQPLIKTPEANVKITYSCTDVGFAGNTQKVPAVTVEARGVDFNFIVPGLLGLKPDLWSITMPEFATTRTGEDLDTVD